MSYYIGGCKHTGLEGVGPEVAKQAVELGIKVFERERGCPEDALSRLGGESRGHRVAVNPEGVEGSYVGLKTGPSGRVRPCDCERRMHRAIITEDRGASRNLTETSAQPLFSGNPVGIVPHPCAFSALFIDLVRGFTPSGTLLGAVSDRSQFGHEPHSR